MADSEGRVVRPLLVNGEALKVSVEPTRSGGGDKHHPLSPEQARERLLPQVRSVAERLHSVPAQLRSEHGLYLEARLWPNYVAPSYFPTQLLRQIGAVPVGSRADSAVYETKTRQVRAGTRRLILSVTDEGLDRLVELIDSPGGTRSERSAFEEIRTIDQIAVPESARILEYATRDEAVTAWEAVLHPEGTLDEELLPAARDTIDKWASLVVALGGSVFSEFVRTVGGLTFVPLSLPPGAADEAVEFNPLRSLRPIPAVRPTPAIGLRSKVARLLPPTEPSPATLGPSVCVFDTGVDLSGDPNLFPFVIVDLSPEPPRSEIWHGTGVTAATAYGLVGSGVAPRPHFPLSSYRVFPAPKSVPPGLELYWMLDQIKQAVIAGGHKIVNLSLGPEEPVTDSAEPNRWTSELDQLSWEHDVLFVVAAGNDGHEDERTGLHRVLVPADMANGLSVGACDCPEPQAPWTRAEYSSMGPGRQGNRVQPSGVQFGGCSSNPFPLVASDGRFLQQEGTSFAAPLVTHALGKLATRLPRVNTSILRVFAAHFVERHRSHKKLCDEIGRGRLPLEFDDALFCEPSEVHVLYADEIERFQLLGYQVPVPSSIDRRTEVRITLAYASPVEPTQPTEYTEASIEIAFRPHHLLYRFSPPRGTKGRNVELLITSDEARRLLEAGWTASQEPVTRTLTGEANMPEHQLREAGKWETLRHFRERFAPSALSDPRLELSCIVRKGGALDTGASRIPFALLVTAVDLDGNGDYYDEVAQQFAALRPVVRAQVRPEVRIQP